MDDIFTQCREGNAVAVRLWLDNTENDLNQGWANLYVCVYLLLRVNGLMEWKKKLQCQDWTLQLAPERWIENVAHVLMSLVSS